LTAEVGRLDRIDEADDSESLISRGQNQAEEKKKSPETENELRNISGDRFIFFLLR
jgi:hypothetical protein